MPIIFKSQLVCPTEFRRYTVSQLGSYHLDFISFYKFLISKAIVGQSTQIK